MGILHPQDLGIILTYRCHSSCRHCLYNCGPGWEKEPMSQEMLREALETAAAWSPAPQVHLTGGEPFLHFSLLLEGARVAADLGLVCYVETSASWCRDEVEAEEHFSALKEAGLDAILISCSPFHAEKIPPIRTVQATRAALSVFGPQRVIVYLPAFVDVVQRFGLEQVTPISRYESEYGVEGARRALWDGYGIISGGRSGYELGHLAPRRPPGDLAGDTCARELLYAHHSHFDLYGNYVSSFCGGLAVGDWRDLPQVLTRFEREDYPGLITVLVREGPYGLLEYARRTHGYVPLRQYAGKCHLCVDVRRCLAQAGDFEELRPRAFYDNF